MPTIEANGATIAYSDTGPPESAPHAPTVLFGHGLLFSGRMFDAQIGVLRQDFRCVAIDWRGQGASPASRDGYDMDSLTADAAALIRTLDSGPVHYVGLSMGGFVGMRLAARQPALLRSLSLLETTAAAEDPGTARRYRLLAGVARTLGVGAVLSRARVLMFGRTFLADPANQPHIAQWADSLRALRRDGLRRAVLAVADRAPILDELPRISVPTLVLVGEEDVPTPPAHARQIAETIPGAALRVLPRAGHSSTVEQPEAVTGLLREFLRGG